MSRAGRGRPQAFNMPLHPFELSRGTSSLFHDGLTYPNRQPRFLTPWTKGDRRFGKNEGRLTPELSRPPTGALVARLLPAASAEQEACHQRVGRPVGFSELLGGPGHLQHA